MTPRIEVFAGGIGGSHCTGFSLNSLKIDLNPLHLPHPGGPCNINKREPDPSIADSNHCRISPRFRDDITIALLSNERIRSPSDVSLFNSTSHDENN